MTDRFIPKKIADFLSERPGRRYCDSCIQERLGFKWRQQVQLVTATLAVTRSFTRERFECCTCNETKQVIFANRAAFSGDAPRRAENLDPLPDGAARSSDTLVLVAQRSR
jgi:hypothetical protein